MKTIAFISYSTITSVFNLHFHQSHLSSYVELFLRLTKNGLSRENRNDTYLTHVCTLSQSIENLKKIEKKLELSATVLQSTDMSQVCGTPLFSQLFCYISNYFDTNGNLLQVFVWHTRTETPDLKYEEKLIKRGERTDEGMEV